MVDYTAALGGSQTAVSECNELGNKEIQNADVKCEPDLILQIYVKLVIKGNMKRTPNTLKSYPNLIGDNWENFEIKLVCLCVEAIIRLKNTLNPSVR